MEFEYEIESNWCTEELQGVWQPETQIMEAYGSESALDLP